MDKSSLRVQYKKVIERIGDQDRRVQSQSLIHKISSYLKTQSGVWTLYSPLNDEPNLLGLLEDCSHLQWVFPRVESKTQMNFFKVRCFDQMVSSSWGITEPTEPEDSMVSAEEITGCIVPGFAYDRAGVRLGRGGGYYDRYLANFKGQKLGVAFNEGLIDGFLPRESHDQLMDIVVSPDNWVDVKKREE